MRVGDEAAACSKIEPDPLLEVVHYYLLLTMTSSSLTVTSIVSRVQSLLSQESSLGREQKTLSDISIYVVLGSCAEAKKRQFRDNCLLTDITTQGVGELCGTVARQSYTCAANKYISSVLLRPVIGGTPTGFTIIAFQSFQDTSPKDLLRVPLTPTS